MSIRERERYKYYPLLRWEPGIFNTWAKEYGWILMGEKEWGYDETVEADETLHQYWLTPHGNSVEVIYDDGYLHRVYGFR